MSEIKRGYPLGDYRSDSEAKTLGGLRWDQWRLSLINRIKREKDFAGFDDFTPVEDDILREYFTLRVLVRDGAQEVRDINQFSSTVEDKHPGLLDVPYVVYSIRYITDKFSSKNGAGKG